MTIARSLIANLAATILFGGCCPEINVSSNDTDDDRPSWADDLGPRPDWNNDTEQDLSCEDPVVVVQNDLVMFPSPIGEWATVARYNLSASRSVTLTDLKVTLIGDDSWSTRAYDGLVDIRDHISRCWLISDQGNILDGLASIQPDNTIWFEPGLDLFEGWIREVEVKCNFIDTPTMNGDDDQYTAYVSSKADMTFVDNASGLPVTDEEVCFPFGPPNADLESGVTIQNEEITSTGLDCENPLIYQSTLDSSWNPMCAIPHPSLNYGWPRENTSLGDESVIIDLYVPVEGDGQVEVHEIVLEYYHVGNNDWFENIMHTQAVNLTPIVNGQRLNTETAQGPYGGYPDANWLTGGIYWTWSSPTTGNPAAHMPSSLVDIHDQLTYELEWSWHNMVPLYSGIMITANVMWTSPDAPGHIFHTRTNGVYWYVTE
jgi:hypothetical protein